MDTTIFNIKRTNGLYDFVSITSVDKPLEAIKSFFINKFSGQFTEITISDSIPNYQDKQAIGHIQ
jgi:hypothetical protein